MDLLIAGASGGFLIGGGFDRLRLEKKEHRRLKKNRTA